jgi:hypothetical protein
MLELGDYKFPVISPDAANQLLSDVGLDPDGRRLGAREGEQLLPLEIQGKIMTREQALALRSGNRALLETIDEVATRNYGNNLLFKRIFSTGSMAVLRACSYQVGTTFSGYLDLMRGKSLDVFRAQLIATPTRGDILQEVLTYPEIPSHQGELGRAIDYMSLYSVDPDYGDNLVLGAATTFLAVNKTWIEIPPGGDRGVDVYQRVAEFKAKPQRRRPNHGDVMIERIKVPRTGQQ